MKTSKLLSLLKKKDELKDKLEPIKTKVKELHKELKCLDLLIKENCNCSSEDQVHKSSYSYGGYDYQGEDRAWLECAICGKTSNLKIRYTGFG